MQVSAGRRGWGSREKGVQPSGRGRKGSSQEGPERRFHYSAGLQRHGWGLTPVASYYGVQMLARGLSLKPVGPVAGEVAGGDPRFDSLHKALRTSLALVPAGQSELFPYLREVFPHRRNDPALLVRGGGRGGCVSVCVLVCRWWECLTDGVYTLSLSSR